MAVKKFIDGAKRHALFTEQGNSELANKAYSEILSARNEMRNLPDQGVESLKSLINENDAGVRLWASYYLLPVDSVAAIKTLDELSLGPGLIAFSAKVTLQEWKAGRLKII